MVRRKKALTLSAARKQIKALTASLAEERTWRNADLAMYSQKTKDLQAKLADTEDKMLPQKQMILKELSHLVNATSKAVRTTMWALKPPSRNGW